MRIDIDTTDPSDIDVAEIAEALNGAGYFIQAITINGKTAWSVFDRPQHTTTIWVLVTVSDDNNIVSTLHGTEAEAYECLRENFLSEDIDPGVSNDDIIGAMVDYCPDVLYTIESRELEA